MSINNMDECCDRFLTVLRKIASSQPAHGDFWDGHPNFVGAMLDHTEFAVMRFLKNGGTIEQIRALLADSRDEKVVILLALTLTFLECAAPINAGGAA